MEIDREAGDAGFWSWPGLELGSSDDVGFYPHLSGFLDSVPVLVHPSPQAGHHSLL